MRSSGHRVLLVLLAAGAALRLALLLAYTPAYLSYPDSWGYVKAAAGPLFMDDWIRPAGYPALLDVLHAVWSSISFAIVVQHLLGLATVVLIYAAVRRLGAPRWVALAPAAVAALSLDLIYFEHTLLSEAPFTTLFAGALYAVARALEPAAGRAALAWAGLAGLLLALGTVMRSAGLFAVPVAAAALLLAAGPLRARVLRAGALCAVVLACLLGYSAVNQAETGTFGLSEGSGWAVYARAAPFADCRTFEPPEGTEMLCETSDARQRGGPDYYAWWSDSVGRRHFVGPPYHQEVVGAFGREAIRSQPRAYISAVATDLWRFVNPDAGIDRVGNGATPETIALDLRDPSAEELNRTVAEPYYGDYSIEISALVGTLADVQSVVRVHGVLVLLAVVLSLLALPFATRSQRIAILLLGGSAAACVVLSTATTVYNWRYAVPMLPALVGSGALGLHVLAARVRAQGRGATRSLGGRRGARTVTGSARSEGLARRCQSVQSPSAPAAASSPSAGTA